MRSFSKKEAFQFGWRRFKERPLFLIGLFILTTIISGVTGFVAEKVGDGGVGTAVNLIDFAIQVILGMGMTLILLRVYDQVDTDYTDLLEPLHLFWKYLAMTILVLVVVFVGFVLFIIPGIIAGIALAFASYLVIDRNLGPVEALKESMRITHGHRWNLFIFGLSVFFINIFGALFFGVGLIVTIPVSALATVHVYRWLSNPPKERGVYVSAFSKMMGTFLFIVLLGGVALFVLTLGIDSTTDTPELRDEQRKADIVQIKLGAALYRDANGVFPVFLEDMIPDYLAELPTDPRTGDPYSYIMYGDGVDYEVCAALETVQDFGGVYCEFGLELGSGEQSALDGFNSETFEPEFSPE
ncbi:hypothetical protein CL652_00920 [bacterium]|nr:hypothetical protein [bacterium]|tara:strand:+ start:12164 stop:13228 length:1065 start_codon:yes stop_codon:yes gene_type:complete